MGRMIEGDIPVLAFPHPFHLSERIEARAPAGSTIRDIIGEPHAGTHVWITDREIPRAMWSYTRPHPGEQVIVRALPEGDKTLRAVALIAVAAVAWEVAPLAAGAFWGSEALTYMGISMAGQLLVNSLIPPQVPNAPQIEQGKRRGSLTGVKNQIAPYAPIPRPYGLDKQFPLIVGAPYTEVVGKDQFLRVLFCAGYGPLQLSQIKIGDTALDQFDNVELIASNNATLDSNYGGRALNGDPLGLYQQDVSEKGLSIKLADSNGGNSATRTTAPNTQEIGIEFLMPAGLILFGTNGVEYKIRIFLTVEYAPTGTTNWVSITDSASYSGNVRGSTTHISLPGANPVTWTQVYLEGKTPDTIRAGISWTVAPGQYDVRVTATAEYTVHSDGSTVNFGFGKGDSASNQNTVEWTALKSWQAGKPVNQEMVDNTVLIAARIQASDQLSGTLDKLNVIAQALVDVYDTGTGTWSQQPSRNAAWAYADVLAGPANGRAIDRSQIDGAALASWAADLDSRGFTYDDAGGEDTTVFALLKQIASSGLAAWSWQDGKYTIVRDTAQSTPVQALTPRNTWGFSAQRTYAEFPHAVKVPFKDPSDFSDQEVIVYDDGYSADGSGGTTVATKFEQLDLAGCNSHDMAWKYGRYHLAALRLRPDTYTVNMDVENLVARRGDLVAGTHDVTLWGLKWGRIRGVHTDANGDVDKITLDELVEQDGSSTYGVRIRKSDGSWHVSDVTVVAGEMHDLTLSTPGAGIDVGDLVQYGYSGQASVDLLITKIEPANDFAAKLTLVDAAPAIHNADSGAIPAYNPQISGSIIPPAPVVDTVRSDESVAVRTAAGTLSSRIVVAFHWPTGYATPYTVQAEIRPSGIGAAWGDALRVDGSPSAVAFSGIKGGVIYDIRVRGLSPGGLPGAWITIQHEASILAGSQSNVSSGPDANRPPAGVATGKTEHLQIDGAGFTVNGVQMKITVETLPTADRYYLATDSEKLYYDDGTQWRLTASHAGDPTQPFQVAPGTSDSHAGSFSQVKASRTNVEQGNGTGNTTIFDGSQPSTWKQVAAFSNFSARGGLPIMVEAYAEISLDRLTTEQIQGGPGGPQFQYRLLRDGTPFYTSDWAGMSTAGALISLVVGELDPNPPAGSVTYSVEMQWKSPVYQAGTVSVSRSSGGIATLTGSGVHFATYVNQDWEIRVDSINGNFAQIDRVGQDSAGNPAENKMTIASADANNAGWGSDISVSGSTYYARNPQASPVLVRRNYWIKVTEFGVG